MQIKTIDDQGCNLGEGIFWHPIRESIFWFDILNHALFEKKGNKKNTWIFEEPFSAGGWVDSDTILIASSSGLWSFCLRRQKKNLVVKIEANQEQTRSNDGTADPWGGFWIGTMDIFEKRNLGSIYRYYKGKLRKIFKSMLIPNSMCFSHDQRYIYFSDSPTQVIWKQRLNSTNGWPIETPREVFTTITEKKVFPDGAITDSEGFLWNAQWGGSRIVRYNQIGKIDQIINYPCPNVTCPTFGGKDLSILYATSAKKGMLPTALKDKPQSGNLFATQTNFQGLKKQPIEIRHV